MNLISKHKLTSLKKTIKRFFTLREEGQNVSSQDEIKANLELAKFYDEHIFDKDLEYTAELALESYRAAASLGSDLAQYVVGERMLKTARFWQAQAEDLYGSEIQQRYAQEYYRAAFVYLNAAQTANSFLAERLIGLAYYNGWGKEQNLSLGIKLIAASIQQEGTWNKATEILPALGIEPQQFFSLLATSTAQDEKK